MFTTTSLTIAGIVTLSCAVTRGAAEEGRLRAVPFTDVHMTDAFWAPRIETNRSVTIPYCFERCADTGRLSNFARAAGLEDSAFEGIYYNDSDVYKVIEGAAYALAAKPDPELDAYLDALIADIAAAQRPDGYLNTYFTLNEDEPRWTDLRRMHELYCAGHLIEAAVAHHQATGKRALLDVAVRLADHIDRRFGPNGEPGVPGHQEIELALFRLADVTGEPRYADLARFFIEQRGRSDGRELYGTYAQDHAPVVQQTAPVGHAVRAMYMYCAMTDLAARTGDHAMREAVLRLWDETVNSRMAITGGVGARRSGEAFGDAYELPNFSAYNETCAAIGMAFWNHRLALLTGDARFADVLERVLYNGMLSGVSLSGDRFFYPNPLASHGTYHRSPWFRTSCCPVNIARFIPAVPGMMYAIDGQKVCVNLYAESEADVFIDDQPVRFIQRTEYPWNGRIELTIRTESPIELDLHLRIPGWARGTPVPSDLYRFMGIEDEHGRIELSINDRTHEPGELHHGYAVISRTFEDGDTIELNLPMPVRRIMAHERVEANRKRIALQRGPIVYCVEGIDANGHVRNLVFDGQSEMRAEHRDNLLGGVTVLTGSAQSVHHREDGTVQRNTTRFSAIPYYAWDHRQASEMAVWLAVDEQFVEPMPSLTPASRATASASHCYDRDTPLAINDQIEPESSGDESVPRLTWWPHRGTEEWAQLDLAGPATVRGVSVYWFDDTGHGQCRVPASWRLLYRAEGEWREVNGVTGYPVARDAFNEVEFEPVRTTALRIEVTLRDNVSGGILEWKLK